MRKLSATERTAFFVASRDRLRALTFDADTALTVEEQSALTELLRRISAGSPTPGTPTTPRQSLDRTAAPQRRLSPLEAARLRKSVLTLVPMPASIDVFRQVLWSVEEGALRRFEARLAVNIALKKIREGAWTKPNRMPPNWLRAAAPETCSAA
jgi:hypothetical protein